MAMNPEVAQIKKRLDQLTPQEEAYMKFKEKGTIHIQEKFIDKYARLPDDFTELEHTALNHHLKDCKQCQDKYDAVMPLLQRAS